MTYWTREIAGWLLLAFGVGVLAMVIVALSNGHVWQSGPMAVVGIFLFRGGIHLLKVALAARVCERTAAALREPPAELLDERRSKRI
jgi:hypothetical protein